MVLDAVFQAAPRESSLPSETFGGSLIRVLVWSNAAIVRSGLESIVASDDRLAVIRPSNRSSDLAAAVRECAPDVLLIDSQTAALGVLTQSESRLDALAAVVLVDSVKRGEILRLLQSGVRAVLLADSEPTEIQAAIAAAREGLATISPEVLEAILPAGSELTGPDELPPGEPLTSREIEVLALLADGAGNKEIATRLHISEHTAKFHVSSILSKLGAASRAEAVARGFKEGLILI